MRRSIDKAMFASSLVMLVVGLLLLAYGYYAIWFTRHESDWPRAIMSFVYLIPGWALTTMGYLGWRIEELRTTKQDNQSIESA
jgi:hypothetical protein